MIRTAFLLVRDFLHFAELTCGSHASRSREPLSPQATGLLRRAKRQAAALGPCRQDRAHRAGAGDRLATTPHRRATRHARAMAPSGIPPVLALEVAAPWPSSDSSIPPGPDRHHGASESDLGEERIAAELLLKLGVSVSPRTVRRYMRRPVPSRPRSSSQTWRTFVRNHAREILACDFFVVVTATFRCMYVFLVLDIGTRRIVHWNVSEHPTAEWTVQQFRSVLTGEEPYRCIVHDRDAAFSPAVDDALRSMHLRVLKTPVRVPEANAFCERLIGTARRECLDHCIPLNERHLRTILAEWVRHLQSRSPACQPRSCDSGAASQRWRWHDRPATTFREDVVSPRNRFSPVSITSTGLSRSQ